MSDQPQRPGELRGPNTKWKDMLQGFEKQKRGFSLRSVFTGKNALAAGAGFCCLSMLGGYAVWHYGFSDANGRWGRSGQAFADMENQRMLARKYHDRLTGVNTSGSSLYQRPDIGDFNFAAGDAPRGGGPGAEGDIKTADSRYDGKGADGGSGADGDAGAYGSGRAEFEDKSFSSSRSGGNGYDGRRRMLGGNFGGRTGGLGRGGKFGGRSSAYGGPGGSSGGRGGDITSRGYASRDGSQIFGRGSVRAEFSAGGGGPGTAGGGSPLSAVERPDGRAFSDMPNGGFTSDAGGGALGGGDLTVGKGEIGACTIEGETKCSLYICGERKTNELSQKFTGIRAAISKTMSGMMGSVASDYQGAIAKQKSIISKGSGVDTGCEGCEGLSACLGWGQSSVNNIVSEFQATSQAVMAAKGCFAGGNPSPGCHQQALKALEMERKMVQGTLPEHQRLSSSYASNCANSVETTMSVQNSDGTSSEEVNEEAARAKEQFEAFATHQAKVQKEVINELKPTWCQRHNCNASSMLSEVDKAQKNGTIAELGAQAPGDVSGQIAGANANLQQGSALLKAPAGGQSRNMINGSLQLSLAAQRAQQAGAMWPKHVEQACSE
ncbi:MAG: hypothetical protein ABIJ96_16655 [Elusimicrobiota bacterium]